MRRSIRNINPRAFGRFLCPGGRKFDLKGYPGEGIWLCLSGVGNLNRKCEVRNFFFFLAGAYQTHVVVSEQLSLF